MDLSDITFSSQLCHNIGREMARQGKKSRKEERLKERGISDPRLSGLLLPNLPKKKASE